MNENTANDTAANDVPNTLCERAYRPRTKVVSAAAYRALLTSRRHLVRYRSAPHEPEELLEVDTNTVYVTEAPPEAPPSSARVGNRER